MFVPSKEEDSDRITCGNALISEQKNWREDIPYDTNGITEELTEIYKPTEEK